MLLNSLPWSLSAYIHKAQNAPIRVQRPAGHSSAKHYPSNKHTHTHTLGTWIHSLVALKPTEWQSALSWSPIQTFMTSLNFQLRHRGVKSACFSLGLYGNAHTHTHTHSRWILITAVCLGFGTGGGVFTSTSQSFSLFFLISLPSFGNGSRWRTARFYKHDPLRADATRQPSQNRIAWLLHYLDSARLRDTHKWKVVFRKRGLRGTKPAIRMRFAIQMQEIFWVWSVRLRESWCKLELHH